MSIATEYGSVTVDSSLIPYIRERDVDFVARNLRPYKIATLFFDEVVINGYCQVGSKVKVDAKKIVVISSNNTGTISTSDIAYQGTSNTVNTFNAVVDTWYVSNSTVVLKTITGNFDDKAQLYFEAVSGGNTGITYANSNVVSVTNFQTSDMFKKDYASVFDGDLRWKSLDTPTGNTFEWDPKSTYVRKPPYFEGMPQEPKPVKDIKGARVLALLGDSVTTDHISPAGNIKVDSPAGKYLAKNGIAKADFNSYGSRRGNHEVMIRGTFANIRLKNLLLNGVEGGFTKNFLNNGEQTTIYDASMAYQKANVPLVILAGKEYGSGSSRDWAAKGTALLGVRAVIAESFERIHRSNLIGMGVLPLQYPNGENAASLGLTGEETFEIEGIEELNNGKTPRTVKVTAGTKSFDAEVRIDTPGEADYYRHGGIMQYVLRSLLK